MGDSTAQHSRTSKPNNWAGSFFPTQHTPPRILDVEQRQTDSEIYVDIVRILVATEKTTRAQLVAQLSAFQSPPQTLIVPSLSDVQSGTRSPLSLFFTFPPRSPCTRPIDRGAPRWARMLATAWEEAWRWGP